MPFSLHSANIEIAGRWNYIGCLLFETCGGRVAAATVVTSSLYHNSAYGVPETATCPVIGEDHSSRVGAQLIQPCVHMGSMEDSELPMLATAAIAYSMKP